MNRYGLKATLESPLVIRRERQSQRSEGTRSIAGTLLRGALAQAYLQQYGRPDAPFERLFLDEQSCRFGPLDPADRVLPLTAASCKRVPGFLADRAHGMADQLWQRIARRLGGDEPPPELHPTLHGCLACGQDLKGHTGFWFTDDGKPREPGQQWRQRVVAHVGIDRLTHTAAESLFYTLPALEPTSDSEVLSGELEASAEAVVHLQRLLEREDGIVYVGHARTRGCGKVKLEVGDEPLPAAVPDWDRWSGALLAYLSDPVLAIPALSPERHFLFALSLPNGAVLLDELLRYTLDPAGMVAWLPPLPPPDADSPVAKLTEGKPFADGRLWCISAVTRHERVRGWNAAHGLPRQDEWAVSRGAVYAYLFEGDSAGRAALKEQLNALLPSGVGARRNEGFGRVVVSDDFHRLFHQQEKYP